MLPGSVDGDQLHERRRRALELGLEAVRARARRGRPRARARGVDPEILLLSAEADGEHEPLERLLDLLPDVPAGKLAIADLTSASRSDVEELERAGVDAVVVAGDVAGLAGDALPEV